MSAKRLSKDECSSIAHKMTAGIENEITTVKEWFKLLNRQLLEKKVPEPIMSIFSGDSNLSKYIKQEGVGCLKIGKQRQVYTMFDNVPTNEDYGRKTIIIPEEYEITANVMYDKLEALKSKKSILVKELEDVLYKLSTPKRITEHLPEALPFLPEVEENLLPQINLQQFRQKLKEELGEIK